MSPRKIFSKYALLCCLERKITFVGDFMTAGKRFAFDDPAVVAKKMATQGNKMEHALVLFTFVDGKWAIDMDINRELLDLLSLGFIMDFLPDGKYTLT